MDDGLLVQEGMGWLKFSQGSEWDFWSGGAI